MGDALKPRVYAASRTARSTMWKSLRASGENIVSTWIDQASPSETSDLSEVWVRIIDEIAHSDYMILYVEPGDFPLKGAFVETGAALALGLLVVVVAPGMNFDPPSYRPIGSWIKHPNVTFCKDLRRACHGVYCHSTGEWFFGTAHDVPAEIEENLSGE